MPTCWSAARSEPEVGGATCRDRSPTTAADPLLSLRIDIGNPAPGPRFWKLPSNRSWSARVFSNGTRLGYWPLIIETFVEVGRFQGTSYRAATWLHLGVTRHRGKLDRIKQFVLPARQVFVYPPSPNFRALFGAPDPA